MHRATAPYEPSAGFWYAFGGVISFVVGGSLLANTIEDPTVFRTGGLAFIAAGLYLLVVGGVARGSQLARRGSAYDGRASARAPEASAP
jgi:hypothetical protein